MEPGAAGPCGLALPTALPVAKVTSLVSEEAQRKPLTPPFLYVHHSFHLK